MPPGILDAFQAFLHWQRRLVHHFPIACFENYPSQLHPSRSAIHIYLLIDKVFFLLLYYFLYFINRISLSLSLSLCLISSYFLILRILSIEFPSLSHFLSLCLSITDKIFLLPSIFSVCYQLNFHLSLSLFLFLALIYPLFCFCFCSRHP